MSSRIKEYLLRYKPNSVEDFVLVLKSNELSAILIFFNYKIVRGKHTLTNEEKTEVIVDNLCNLNINVIEALIQIFNISYKTGKIPLYIKAVDCSPKIFGFINSYYNVNMDMRNKASAYAISNNNLENLKKIKGLKPELTKKLYLYFLNVPEIDKKIIEFLKDKVQKSQQQKDYSPEDVLNSILKQKVNKKIENSVKKHSRLLVRIRK